MIKQHNASNSLEEHCIVLVNRYLERLKYPSKRLPIEVVFDYSLNVFARHKIRYSEPVVLPLKGFVELRFSSVCLFQSPTTFYRECIPHELAHIFQELEARKKGLSDIPPHGYEWQTWLSRLSTEASPSSSGPDVFDMRAVTIHKGGVPCACQCGDLAGFHAVPNSQRTLAKLDNGEITCESCQTALNLVSLDSIPQNINKELSFIRDMICKQPHLTPLYQTEQTV